MLLALEILTGLLVVATALPHLPMAHGAVRFWDFPRQQIAIVAAALFLAALLVEGGVSQIVILSALAIVIALQLRFIIPFTPLSKRQTADHEPNRDADGHAVTLLACNVKQSNDKYARLEAIITKHAPDMIILMEVDAKWMKALANLLSQYKHTVLQPQDNSYGMAVLSRFALSEVVVSDLLTKEVPSVRATVTVRDDIRFRLYAIHPEPPAPNRSSEGRDGETALVATLVREDDMPVLVTGDLNDVAWSGTTSRFRRISGLLDPRIGRKVFSTFDARVPVVRWPLDHLFHSAHFRLKEMHRLPRCGSDHFPVLFEMVLCKDEVAHSRPEAADVSDIERARELTAKAASRDKKPIGSDWEE